ncbi:MAG: hypothetical protein NTY31_02470 [Candidatus Falkowbacteria bacterium]|nr:hypothetical protein [Candidatus Falkowbacteria bacterium]
MPKKENLDGRNKDIDLKNYNDKAGVSLKRMNFGLWVAEHRRRIIKLFIAFLISLSAFFFIYSSYYFVVYLISGDPNAQLLNDNLSFSARQAASALEISSPQVFDNDGQPDLAVQIVNPNEKFMANFSYCFKLGDKDVACGQAFILPAEKKYILALASEFSGRPSELSFSISDIFWRRIDAHQIPSWADFYSQRLDFAISDLDFTTAALSGLSDKINLNTLGFSIKNQTAYGYYEAPLNIFLYSGSDLVAVNRYLLQNFLSGETRVVKISWPGRFDAVNRTEVAPDINIMDDNVYLKYQGTSAN